MKIKILLLLFTDILFIFLATGCSQKLSDSDVVVTERLFSPDSTHVVFTYYINHGAMGETPAMASLMNVKDTLEIINEKNRLPCYDLPFYACYYPKKWLNNTTLEVWLNERPFVKESIPFNSKDFTLNGINCKVVPHDLSREMSPLIEFVNFSADRKKVLVAYRYDGDLNISAFNYGEKLPHIGNIFTNYPVSFNPVRYADWNGNSITIFVDHPEDLDKSDYLNKKIPYKVAFADIKNIGSNYSGNDFRFYTPLYSDKETDMFINSAGRNTTAIITTSEWRRDNNDKSLYYYEYEYMVDNCKYRSYFRIFEDFKNPTYKEGDPITIRYDTAIPFLHRTEKKHAR